MLRKIFLTTISMPLLATLSACGNQMAALENVGKEPSLATVEVPMAKENYIPLEWDSEEEEALQPRHANSLWQPGGRTFFKDTTARRIGDILKVVVEIKDKAELDNETERKRTSDDTSQASKIFGLEEKIVGMIPGVANPAALLDLQAASNAKGTGTIAREEKIQTEVAAMVTQVLPNGNLVIHGDQEVRVNFEVRKVTVDGIVDPDDISAIGTVESGQIAEARISYGGRGQITNVQQPRIGSQIIDILSPF